MDPTDSGTTIPPHASEELNEWTGRFSHMVRESASRLAAAGTTPGLITSETLAEAVRATCERLAAELGNHRRLALIRKSLTVELTAEERAELDRLQAELDQRLEAHDDRLLGELQRMTDAVEQLPAES